MRHAAKVALFGKQASRPKTIGRFEVIRLLGSGGMGSVFECRDPTLDRTVAIKLLLEPGEGEEPLDTARARLRREARVLAKLNHPNLVQLYEVGEHKGEMFVVMELVEGQTLDRWAEETRPDWRTAARLVAQVCRALTTAHEAGIVHRDIKPGNVMVGTDGRARVLDFGIARPLNRAGGGSLTDASFRTAQGKIVGTPAYMAPEQLASSTISPATDSFAVGLVLYELLAGRRAFQADTPARMIVAISVKDPEPLPEGVPDPLRRLVLRLLEKKPGARPADLGRVANDLEAIADGKTPAMGSRGMLLAGIGAAVLVAVAVLVAMSL